MTDSIDVAGLAVTLVMVMRIATAYGARIDETAPPLLAAMSGMPGVPVGWGVAVTAPALARAGGLPAAATAPTAAAPAVLPPAAWHPDPAGRHQLRWWDGTEWTEWVGDGGVMSEDPV